MKKKKDKSITMSDYKKLAKKIDITKFSDKKIKRFVKAGDMDKLSKKDMTFCLLAGMALKCVEKNKVSLSEKEVADAIHEFYICLCLEYLTRKGYLIRKGNWKTGSYKMAEKYMDMPKELLKKINIFK